MTEKQTELLRMLQVWESIRLKPGITLTGMDYVRATELKAIGVVESRTHDDGDDTWHITPECVVCTLAIDCNKGMKSFLIALFVRYSLVVLWSDIYVRLWH